MKIRVLVATLLGVLLAATMLITYGLAQEGDVDTVTAESEAEEYYLVQTPLLTGEACSEGRQGGTPNDILYFWDFEGTNGGFVGTLDWEWGTYAWAGTCGTYYEPPAAYSGTDMWGTVLNGCYNNLGNNSGFDTCINGNPADDSILSFTIDLTGVTDPVEMSWWEWYDLFMNWDWGEVYANGNVVFQHCGTGYVIPTEWEQQVVDLTPYIGGPVDIEFHMMASSVVERAGWWIDDVMVYTVANPKIVVDAPPLEAELCPDASETITFTICNTGNAPLVWEILEMSRTLQTVSLLSSGGSFLSQPAPPSARTAVTPQVTSQAECATYENYAGTEPLGYAEFCMDARPSPAVSCPAPAAPTDIGYAQDIGYISDNFVTFALNDFPGQTVLGTSTNAYYGMDFDPTATTLYALNDTTDELGTIDLADGTFTGLVPCPAPVDIWTGLSIDPMTGVFYASDATNLYTIDPATGAYTLIGPFGTSLMIDIAMGPNGDMYGHDIGTDSIYLIDPATGAATLIGAPTGYNANYAQGMDFDNDDGTLYIFLYIGSGSNVYGIVDLATGGVIPLAIDNPLGEFEGATQTAGLSLDVPWLSEVPANGVLDPGLCEVVEVTFDSTGMMPGEYLADLIINSNDPLTPSITLPATMTVWAPADILDVIYGVDGLTVTFDALVAGDGPLTYAWDFGDGNTSDLEDPVHAYDQGGCYLVTLDVNSTCGMDTWSAEICLCEPVAGTGFTWMPTMPVVDATIYFTATEPLTGTSPFTYTWDFGDELYGEGITATHVYTAAGDYDVTLLVENACGETMVTDTVTIIPACGPVSGLDFNWSPAAVGETVFFTATQPLTGTPPFTYTWDFGDGFFGEGINATHVYTAAGDYEVTLTVQNACSESSTTDTVTVEVLFHYTYLPIVVRDE